MSRDRVCYGTPHPTSMLRSSIDIDEISANDSNSDDNPQNRSNTVSKKPKVVRIWHPDNLFVNIKDSELSKITSFKSSLITETTTAKDSRDFVAHKLLLGDSIENYKIYAIKEQEKTPLHLNTLLLQVLESNNDIKLAFLCSSEDESKPILIGTSVFELGSEWDMRENSKVAHRRLLNYNLYSPFSDVCFTIENTRVSAFRCLIDIRCPQLLEFEGIIKKRKEKKTSTGTFLTLKIKEDCFLTLPVLLQLLDYLYSDQLDFPKLNIKEILLVERAANNIGIKRLECLCAHYIYTTMGMHNVHEIIKNAHELDITTVKKFSIAFAHQKWVEFAAHKVGLDILGLDLFQELAVTQSQNQDVGDSFLEENIPQTTYSKDLQTLYEKMEYTDAIAEFENGSIVPFHRCLWAAYEPKFAQLFTEKKDHKNFKNFNISIHAFKYIQQYICTGNSSINPECSCEIIEELVFKYDIESFRALCETVLLSGITSDIVLRILSLTYLSWNENRDILKIDVRNTCLEHIVDNFEKIDIPSIRTSKQGIKIAHDLLDTMHFRKRDAKRRRFTGLKNVKPLQFK